MIRGLVLGSSALGLALVGASIAGVNLPLPHRDAPAEGTSSEVRVVAVVDGDTLRVETLVGDDLGRVRLLGIDAPEIAHPPENAECYGATALSVLEQLTPAGSTVVLVPDTGQDDRDRYGRLLRYVDVRGVDASQELRAAGAARLYDTSPELARGDTHESAAGSAQEHDEGLWGNC